MQNFESKGGCLDTFLHVLILIFHKAKSYFLINLKFKIKREHNDLLKKDQTKTAKKIQFY